MVDIRNINLYLKLTINLGYFHQEIQDMAMIWYNYIGSFFDPNNAISMTAFAGIAFIWKSSKWAFMVISSYLSDIIALSKSIAKYAWLNRMINHIQNHVVEIHQNYIIWFIKTLPLVLLKNYRLYEEQYRKVHCSKNYLSSRIIEIEETICKQHTLKILQIIHNVMIISMEFFLHILRVCKVQGE